MREALPARPLPAGVVAVVAVITAVPSSLARCFFVARALGLGITDGAGVSSSSSSDCEEVEDAELGELREIACLADCFSDKFRFSELESDDDESLSELESELEEDAALRFDLTAVGGPLPSSGSESELELESELEGVFALRFGGFGSSSSSSEPESELELEVESEGDTAGFFVCKVFLLLFPSLEQGTDSKSVSTSDLSLEFEPVSSVDSSSLSASSAEESVLLESRLDSWTFAVCGTPLWGVSSLSSLLSSELQ